MSSRATVSHRPATAPRGSARRGHRSRAGTDGPAWARARQLLAQAATLDIDRGQFVVRCRVGDHEGWWELEQTYQLLDLATEVALFTGAIVRELVVVDGLDVYRFDVS